MPNEDERNLWVDSETGEQGVWDACNSSSDYVHNAGLLMIPVANGPPRFVRTHAAYMTRNVSFSEVKTGERPKVPHPTMGIGSNDVYLGAQVVVQTPKVGGNGIARVFSISGVYTYGMRTPLAIGDNDLPTAQSPEDSVQKELNTFPGHYFYNLIDSTDAYIDQGQGNNLTGILP